MDDKLKLDLVRLVQIQYYKNKRKAEFKKDTKVACQGFLIFILACFLAFLLYNVYAFN